MKRIISGLFVIVLIFGFTISYGECSPPVRANTYTSGSVIDPSDVTANEDAIFTYLTAGVDTLASNAVDASGEIADGVILNADVNASAAIAGSKITPTFAANTSPSADDTYDLGTSSLEWQDIYIDGLAYIDGFGEDSDMGDFDLKSIDKLEGVDVDTFIDMGVTDTIEIKGDIVPNADDADDLGSSLKEFKDLYIDGIANIDTASLTAINANTTITVNESGNNDVVDLINDGTGDGLYIDHNGIIAAGKHALYVDGSAATVAADSALVKILQDSASASEPALEIVNDGTGATIEMGTKGAIKFPSTAVSDTDVNTIDDYEEGTYTATLTCGTSGTITVDGSVDTLTYTKIGRAVHVQGKITSSGISSPVGALTVNLPFTSSSLAEQSDFSSGSVIFDSGTGNVEALSLYLAGGASTSINIIEQVGTGCTLGNDVANHIDANTDIIIQFTYIVE